MTECPYGSKSRGFSSANTRAAVAPEPFARTEVNAVARFRRSFARAASGEASPPRDAVGAGVGFARHRENGRACAMRMTRGQTRHSRGVGFDRPWAAVAVLVALAACAVGARAHIDPDDPDHKPGEEHARPPPPLPTLDRDTVIGGVYDTPLLLREDGEYEMMCSVIVKPPGFMYVAPNVTINVRGDCLGGDAIAWNAGNPGGTGMKPSVVILPGARLDVRGTPEKPVVFKKLPDHNHHNSGGTTRGDWGGVYMFGRARVSYGESEQGHGQDASEKFVARHAPLATFPACENHQQPPFCEDFQPSSDSGDTNLHGYLPSHHKRFEYGGKDDGGSCGSLESLVIVNAGGGDSHSVTKPVALGLYGCGVATNVSNVEVAHADGVGIELRGGAALVRNAAVWHVSRDAVSASGGYRGAMRNVFVDVDGAQPYSALRVEGDGVGATVYRTHPHVYSSTFVASGDDDGYYASLEATNAPPPAVNVGVVSAANGAGLSLLNTIVLSRSNRRSRGVEVSGCSNEMDVGNEAAIGAPDAAEATPTSARLFVSDRNVIAGFGAHLVDAFGAFPTSMHEVLSRTGEYHYVGSSTTRRVFDETWLAANATPRDERRFEEVPARDWRAFGLSSGCEAKLNLADYKRPQLHSLFFPSETSAAVLDPRPTEGMRVAHKVDQPSIRASRGFALSANAPPTAKAMIDAFLSEPVEFPGAFTPDLSSVWFGPSVRNEPLAVEGVTLTSAMVPEAESTRLYGHFRMYATGTATSAGSTILSGDSGSGGGSGSGGDSGSGGYADSVCPAWERAELCRLLGGESEEACSSVDGEVGVACQYVEGDCVPASGADAYFQMVEEVETIARSYGDEQCGVNATQEDCEAYVAGVSAALADAGVDTLARNYFAMDVGPKGCHILQDEAACFASGFCKWGIHQPGGGFSCAGNAFAVADAAHCLCANVSAPSIGSFATVKNVSASNACFDAPLVNVVVEQNACYRAPKWFSDRASPASGVARAGNFDPSTAWRAFDAFDEDDTSVDDVIADVPETLGHVLLDDAAFDVGVDSWAHGSVVAQILADSVLAAYKRGARSQGVGAKIAIVRAAHVARDITAGPFTRGDAAATLSSPEETFKAANLTGAEIEELLTAGATASDSTQFAFAAGARFSFNAITPPEASGFQVLADGSDREWTALDPAKKYTVVLAGSESQSGTPVGGTMRDVFFEYAMSAGTLLRPPPWSRSIRELITTADGVNAHAFDLDAAAHIKLVVRDGSVPALRVYASRTECEHDEESGVAAAEGLFVEDAGDHCAHGEVDIVQVDILPGTLSSDNRVVTEEWTDALECPRDAETNARTPAMFTFYNASGDAPAYVFDGVQPRSAPEAEESVASGRRKLLSSSSATQCAANEHVQSGICVACPSGKIKAAGDDPSGPDTECYNPGIAVRDGGDVAGSPCYHILGAETGSRQGTQRFFCDASGSLTVVKWFTGSDGELKNPSCDVSAVPDEISYGAHRINFRNDLASCDAPSAFDAARSLAFAKLEGSCGSLAHAAAYARLDGRAGPFASGTRYAFPYAQRLEGAPWGCSTDDCNRARELGYKI